MTASHLELIRAYVVANGGHAAVAAANGLSAGHLAEVTQGRRPPNAPEATAMSTLIGVTVPRILAADPDEQLAARHGAL